MAVKHHWWWQFNFVFQRLEVAAEGKWTGDVLYIEEDNYVAPDILTVLAQMRSIATEQCGAEKCGVLNLGLKTQEAVSDNGAGWEHRGNALGVAGWESSKHNMGMVRPRAPPPPTLPRPPPAPPLSARAFAAQTTGFQPGVLEQDADLHGHLLQLRRLQLGLVDGGDDQRLPIHRGGRAAARRAGAAGGAGLPLRLLWHARGQGPGLRREAA